MKTLKILIITGIVLSAFSSCKETELKPIEKDGTAPGTLSNPTVESLAGAAKITYNLPGDPDILYVQASYKNQSGQNVEFKSSYYSNFIVVEGFADSAAHNVEMYVVDKSGNRSALTTVSVTPKAPPYLTAYKSLAVVSDFGGASFSFKNLNKAELAVVVSTPDSTGKMRVARTFYTARDSANFSLRGYASESRVFNIFVRDKWGNSSEVLSKELTPIYEVQLDKKKFREMFLPGDAVCNFWDGAMPFAWDGKAIPDQRGAGLHTGNASTGVPKYITFDLGVQAQLSRFSQQTIQDERHWYNDVSLRRYEVWGISQYNTNGSFDGWTKLATVTNVKPSGLPTGIFTEDDRVAGRIGDEVNIPVDMPKVRYIRIRCLQNWSGNTNMCISEMTFWGNDK
ncbi:DUF4959 domain-containing protein [Pedobacter hiemivivus]|uniref:DUF4959 domain-containing protein n=2 Tax=Pedobacter hiemivivus TaxID=2530454 RepID=A0A4R0NAM3_9SPHI|nr:DUF4959 domain-containing protein [Pedobacter hiemivivus]